MSDVVIELIPGKIVFVRKTTGMRKSISCVAATVKGTWVYAPGRLVRKRPVCRRNTHGPQMRVAPTRVVRGRCGRQDCLPPGTALLEGKAVTRKNSRWSRFLSCFAERALLHLGFDDQKRPRAALVHLRRAGRATEIL